MSMKANCVNVLNKTVSSVCKLENQVQTNTQNIDRILKQLNFNKNLMLSLTGTDVKIKTTVQQYSIDPRFVENRLLNLFILGIISYLNTNLEENYYLLIENSANIPNGMSNIHVPSIIQVSLVYPNKSELVSLLDSIKSGNFSKLSSVIDLLHSNFHNPTIYTSSILFFLSNLPEINFFKESEFIINGYSVSKTYEDLNNKTKNVKNLMMSSMNQKINEKNIIDNLNYYIKKGQEFSQNEYKNKSHNDPYYPHPDTQTYMKTALDLFLKENNLALIKNGEIINYNISNQENQPNEPFSPFDPSEPSNDYFSKITDFSSISESTLKIENKIKLLLELTETETEPELDA